MRISRSTGTASTLAIGPVTEHFANQARNSENSLIYGLAPTFEAVPAGYTIETVLVVSNRRSFNSASPPDDAARISIPEGGVNAALMEFGDYLLARHNKTRALGNHKPETEYTQYGALYTIQPVAASVAA